MKATIALMERGFIPFWDKERMDSVLAFLGELSQRLPCRTLSFLPQPDVVETIQCLLSI